MFFKKAFLKELAKKEKVGLSFLEDQIKKGRVVIPLNKKHKIPTPVAIGEGLKIKINTNLGTSTSCTELKDEIEKLKIAIASGTHTVMDLSVGGDSRSVRKEILKNSTVPVGTVPLYEAAKYAEEKKGSLEKMNFKDIHEVLRVQAEEGIDFFTIHAGILKKALDLIEENRRVGGIVSRGGAILARWMQRNKKENPLYENFEEILKLAREYNITLSLGDALRPGAIADSTDQLQLFELKVLAELVKRAQKKGVQVMVEGPGHIRLDEITLNIALEKRLCSFAPFYILGPLPLDIAAGHDHISASIGAAIAGLAGADFFCVVSPAEHLRHPSVEDIKEGVIASRIAAHAVDALRFKDEWERDLLLSRYRARRNWKKMFPFFLDKDKAKKYRKDLNIELNLCSMCGDFCSLKMLEKCNLLI